MADVKKTIKLDYVSSGLEEIGKKLKEVTASGLDLDLTGVQEMVQKIETLLGQDTKLLTDNQVGQLIDEFNNLVLSVRKLGVEIHTVFDEDAKTSLLDFEDQLTEAYEKAQKLERELTKIKEISEEVEAGDLSSITNVERKETQNKAADNIGETMISPTGRRMTDAANFIKIYEKFLADLEEEKGLQEGIVGKLKEGQGLNETELANLNEIISAKERVKINAEEIVKQSQLSFNILKQEKTLIGENLEERKAKLVEEQADIIDHINGIKKVREEVFEDVDFTGIPDDVIQKIMDLSNSIESLTGNLLKLNSKAKDQLIKNQEQTIKNTKKITSEVEKETSTLGKAAKQVFAYGTAFAFLKRIYKETLNTIKNLDKALTDMAVVTTMSRREAWQLTSAFQELAKQTGFTTTEIAELSTIYFRQGRTLSDVIELTTVAAKAAKIAGITAAESADYLTATVNGFALAAEEAEAVSDKFAALAANSASSYEELAVGLTKFAAQAKVAGISIDFAMGMLSKGIETTREAPETIGTALKTVISRMRELSDFGKTLEDGMDLNRVDKALKAIGVRLTDSRGNFRDMESVLKEVGDQWDRLNTTQQASVAVALAGTRQQSRLIAIMSDFDRTLELTKTSQESAGATAAQHAEYMKGLGAAMTNLQNSWQKFITTITESEVIIGVVNSLTAVIEGVTSGLNSLGVSGKNAMVIMAGLTAGIKGYSIVQKLMNEENALGNTLRILLNKSKKETITLDEIEAKITKNNIALTGTQNSLNKTQGILKRENIKDTTRARLVEEEENLTKQLGIFTTEAAILAEQKELLIKKETGKVTKEGLLTKIKNIAINKLEAMGLITKTAATNATTAATNAATVAQEAHNTAVKASPLGWIAIVIMGVVAAFALYKKGTEDAAKGTDSFASSFATAVQPVVDLVKSLIKYVVRLVKAVFELGKKIIGMNITISFLIGYIKSLVDYIGLLISIIELVVEWLIMVVEEVVNLFKKIPLIGKVIGAIENFSTKLKGGLSFLKKWSKGIREATQKLKEQKMTYDELAASIKKAREEREVESYNLKQENKSFDKILGEYDEYKSKESLGIITDEDRERLKELEQELIDFNESLPENEKVISFNSDGSINWKESEKAMREWKDVNAEKIAKNMTENYEDAMKLAKKDIDSFMRDEDSLQVVLDYSIFSINPNKNWTDKERKALEKLFEEGIKTMGKDFDPSKINADSFLSKINLFEDNIENNGDLFSKRVELYQKALEGMTLQEAEAFKRSYSEYTNILNLLGDDYDRLKSTLDNLDLNSDEINGLALAAKSAGVEMTDLLEDYQDFYDSLPDTMSGEEKEAVALQQLQESYKYLGEKGKDLRLVLKTLASGGSIQSVAHEMDRLNSVINNLNDSQQKFIEGKITDAEIFELFEAHAELFSDPDFVDNFVTGRGLMSVVGLQERMEQQKKYKRELARLKQEIKSLSGEERKAMQGEINRLELLTSYRGSLAGMTKEQINYNNALKAYNNLLDLGFDSITMQQKIVQMAERNISTIANKTTISMNAISSSLNSAGLKWEELYYTIEGTVMLTDEAIKLLEDPALSKTIKEGWEKSQDILDQNRNSFKEFMNYQVSLAQKIADEKIKIYEQYFKSLDKLEEKRNKKETRESLIKQLQRLEGATDERSRKKALDLRKELNKLNEEESKTEIEEARTALTDSFKQVVEDLKKTFENAWLEFLNMSDLVGKNVGEALIEVLYNSGLIKEDTLLESEREENKRNLSDKEKTLDDKKGAVEEAESIYNTAREERIKAEEDLADAQEALDSIDRGKETLKELHNRGYAQGYENYDDFLRDRMRAQELQKIMSVGDDTYETHDELAAIIQKIGNSKVVSNDTIMWEVRDAVNDTMDKLRENAEDKKEDKEQILTEKKAKEEKAEGDLEKAREEFNETYEEWAQAVKDYEELYKLEYDNKKKYVDLMEELYPNIEQKPIETPKAPSTTKYNTGVKGHFGSGGGPDRYMFQKYAKGGFVDYTGIAMLHGSKTDPEAVLSSDQTKMFIGLRDTLENVGSDGIGSVAIGSITISPQELNNNQDWKAAGQVLAKELQAGLRKTGINVNRKR